MSGLFVPPSIPISRVIEQTYTVATLPDPAQCLRMYAWVTDLFGGPGDYCISDGVSWKPVRPLSVKVNNNADANMTFTSLLSQPTQVLQGALTTNRTHTLSTSYAYAGSRFRIKNEMTMGLFSISLVGLITVSLGLGKWVDMEYNGTAWIQTASGGIL